LAQDLTVAGDDIPVLVSQLAPLGAIRRRFIFQIDEVETNFLSANSISEFSHSHDS
jgi:hypothetical protein